MKKRFLHSLVCGVALCSTSVFADPFSFSVPGSLINGQKTLSFFEKLNAKDSETYGDAYKSFKKASELAGVSNLENLSTKHSSVSGLITADKEQSLFAGGGKLNSIASDPNLKEHLKAISDINKYKGAGLNALADFMDGSYELLKAGKDLGTTLKVRQQDSNTTAQLFISQFSLAAFEKDIKALDGYDNLNDSEKNALLAAARKKEKALKAMEASGGLSVLDGIVIGQKATAEQILNMTLADKRLATAALLGANSAIKKKYDSFDEGGASVFKALQDTADWLRAISDGTIATTNKTGRLSKKTIADTDVAEVLANIAQVEELLKHLEQQDALEDLATEIGKLSLGSPFEDTVIKEIQEAGAKKQQEKVAAIIEEKMDKKIAKIIAKKAIIAQKLGKADEDLQTVTQLNLTKSVFEGGLKEAKQQLIELKKGNLSPQNEKAIKEAIAKAEEAIQTALNESAKVVAKESQTTASVSALGSLNAQINNMNKRMGELRGLESDAGAWVRVYGGESELDNIKTKSVSTQIGADKGIQISDGTLYTGVLAGFDDIKNDEASQKAYSGGIYASYVADEGFFSDAMFKYVRTSHKEDGASFKKQNMFLASFEGGYRFNVDSKYIEPSLELISGSVGKFEKTDSKGTKIEVKSFAPIIVKPQVFVGLNQDNVNLRTGVGAVINAHSKPKANVSIDDFTGNDLLGTSEIKLKKHDYGFLAIGGSYAFSKNLRLNLNAEHTFASPLKSFEFSGTLRYAF